MVYELNSDSKASKQNVQIVCSDSENVIKRVHSLLWVYIVSKYNISNDSISNFI